MFFCVTGFVKEKQIVKGEQQQDDKEALDKEDDEQVIRVCTAQERLVTLKEFCRNNPPYRLKHSLHYPASAPNSIFKPIPEHYHLSSSNNDTLDLLSDASVKKLAHQLWMDPENKVIVCMHAKAGCSTWKAILANNTGQKPMSSSVRGKTCLSL